MPGSGEREHVAFRATVRILDSFREKMGSDWKVPSSSEIRSDLHLERSNFRLLQCRPGWWELWSVRGKRGFVMGWTGSRREGWDLACAPGRRQLSVTGMRRTQEATVWEVRGQEFDFEPGKFDIRHPTACGGRGS